ncbi:MAG: MBL fold metallo-hydrolase [Brevinemataceae bacterium]
MKLTFLGTGTSSGIPVIGCSCNICLSKDPRNQRTRCAALIQTHNLNILIDAGPDIRKQLLDNSISQIDTLLITHQHYDHIAGIDELRPLSWQNPIPVYLDLETHTGIKTFFPYLFNTEEILIQKGLTRLHTHIIQPFEEFTVQKLSIMPISAFHGNMNILGYKIENLVYLTDVKTLPQQTIDIIKNIDTLVINCLRHLPHPTHLNIKEMLKIVNIINPKRCYLIHLNHEISAEECDRILPLHIKAAYDNLEIQI